MPASDPRRATDGRAAPGDDHVRMDDHDHWLPAFFLGVLGIYVFFAALALAEVATVGWLWLLLGAFLLFGCALWLGAGGLKRLLKS